MWFLYGLTGVFGGVLGGMGMGGGTLLIPMLTTFFSVGQHTAQSVNLIAFIPMSIVALTLHFLRGLVDWKCALKTVVPAIILGVLGAILSRAISPKILGKLFGGFLVILSLFQLLVSPKKAQEKSPIFLTDVHKPLASFVPEKLQNVRYFSTPNEKDAKKSKKARSTIDKR